MSNICVLKAVNYIHRIINTKCLARRVAYCSYSYNTNKKYFHEYCSWSHRLLTQEEHHRHSHRLYSNRVDQTIAKDQKENAVYHELYLIEKIRFLRLLGRFSKYSCVSLALGSPLCLLLTSLNEMTLATSQSVIAILVLYSALFTGQSFLFTSRILGKMMISEDERTIKLSHLSLFGMRKDVFIQPSDIVPVQDVHSELSKKMTFVRLNNSKRFIFFPQLGTFSTNFEALELILSGGVEGRKH